MEQSETSIRQLTDHLFRHESGKMISVLSRITGLHNIDTAQDIVQDTLLQAMQTWRFTGIPSNPSGWLHRVAKNKAIDWIRRKKKFDEIRPEYAYLLQSEYTLTPTISGFFLEEEIKDSQLQMIFACCHPAIPVESQVALTLKTLCGLSTIEIARAFLTMEDTIQKRIYRAMEKIRQENIELEAPGGDALAGRLGSVLKTLYLLFNEGYNSSHPERLIREDLCEEAMRLCVLLLSNPVTRVPRTHALLSLMCFQASRLSSRLDDRGHIILLQHQDRSKWDLRLIQLGFDHIDKAAEPFEISTYHFEAAIASLHAAAPSFEKTNWKKIYEFYSMLYQNEPSPVVAMNKAIAASYAVGPGFALQELKQVNGLEHHHIYYASLGELYLANGEKEQALDNFKKAIALTDSYAEQKLLSEKMANCI